MIDYFKKEILRFSTFPDDDFVLDVFRYQASTNIVYTKYLSLLNVDLNEVKCLSDIPFLPIELFKFHEVKTAQWQEEMVFESSGTTGQIRSKHYVNDLKFYNKLAKSIFERQYGSLADYKVLALLPSYLERNNSSLVYMVEHFIKNAQEGSGFFLNNLEQLKDEIKSGQNKNHKILVIGVSFGLLDWADKENVDLSEVIIMETGGMKGRRKEMTREELHHTLQNAFNVTNIHSEYGMTELFSQCYAPKAGRFLLPPSMNVMMREINDPLSYVSNKKTGLLNIIDLGNIDTCCFISTQDIGRRDEKSFEILGRSDISEVRGCNLMVYDL